MIKRLFTAAFTCPFFVLSILGGLSIFALAAALTSQYGFGMRPCDLCLYQRIPYAVVILLAALGMVGTKMMGRKYGALNIGLSGIAFLINAGIAFYHVGVEQHWWASGCTLPDLSGMNDADMMAAIRNAPTVSCDQIPFELFGISMAGYNVIICLLLGIYALTACTTVIRSNGEKA